MATASGEGRWLTGWVRGLRGRLVITYTLTAILLTTAGGLLFVTELRAALQLNVDDALASRAAPLVTSLRTTGEPDFPEILAPTPRPANGDLVPDTFAVVLSSTGAVVDSSPAHLPALPITAGDRALASRAPLRLTSRIGREGFRLLITPVHRPGRQLLVVVGSSLGTVQEATGEVERALLVAGPAIVVLVAVGAWLLSGAALRPVERMRADAAEIGAQLDSERLTVPRTGDEIEALARTFNELLDRLQRSLIRQRDLVADAGHELRTPLSVLRVELELADRPQRSPAELRDAVRHARVEADRLSRLADDLLFLARLDGAAPLVTPVDQAVGPVLAETVRAVRTAAAQRGVAVRLAVDEGVAAPVDGSALRRVLDNLLANALRHTPAGGTVTVSAAAVSGRTRISVQDTGPGFPPGFLPHAFERFSRGDPSRTRRADEAGSGLGLSIVSEIVAAHGGTVSARNLPDGGAEVVVDLPSRSRLTGSAAR